MKTIQMALGVGLAVALLGGCGGSDSTTVSSDADGGTGTGSGGNVTAFTGKANWTAATPSTGATSCFDFDLGVEVPACDGTAWDVKLVGGRAASLATNSGPNGSGSGGAFGSPFDHEWSTLQTWTSATVDPSGAPIPINLYAPDTAAGAFTGDSDIASAAFEYNLMGDHRLHPNFRVFLVTTDSTNVDSVGSAASPVYAVQLAGYYGGATGTESGHVFVQWLDRAQPAAVRTASFNARNGWAYLDLATGALSSESGSWQIAFDRYRVKLNGGISGTGKVAGLLASTPDGLYDGDGAPIVAAFESANAQAMQARLTASDLEAPARASDWIADAASSTLAPAYAGQYPQALDYGWYRYFPTADAAAQAGLPAVAHSLAANPERASLIRSGSGDSYARMRLTSIVYADPADSASAQTWTIEFDVQPANP